MKFRKRITILPGVRLNISGSGLSVTGGVPGLSVNVGKRGAYLNTGIPGTGLYDRHRLDRRGRGSRHARGGKLPTETRGAGRRGPGEASTSGNMTGGGEPTADLLSLTGNELVDTLDLRFAVEDDGTVGTFFPDGLPVEDARILRKVRRSEFFRAAAEELRQSYVEDLERETAAIMACASQAPPPMGVADVHRQLAELHLEVEQPRAFPVSAPAESDTRAELEAAARRCVSFWPPWNRNRRRAEFVDEHLHGAMKERRAAWEADRDEHDRREAERVEARNRELRRAHDTRQAHLEGLLAGTAEEVSMEFEQRMKDFAYPLPFEIELDIDDAGTVDMTVDLPEIEDLPQETARILASGKLSVRNRSESRLEQDYRRAVAALGLALAGFGFAASPAIHTVQVHGFTQRINPASGHEEDVTVLRCRIDRERFTSLRLSAGDPEAMLRSFSPETLP